MFISLIFCFLICSDDLIALIVEYLKENTWLWQVGLGSFGIGIVVSVILKYMKRKEEDKQKKPKKEK